MSDDSAAPDPEPKRYFDEGEEPPDRYDLEGEMEHILPQEFSVEASVWFRSAWREFSSSPSYFIRPTFIYGMIWLIGYSCAGSFFLVLLDPPLSAGLTLIALDRLTCRTPYRDLFGGFRFFGPLVVVSLLASVIQAACFIPLLTWVIGANMLATNDHVTIAVAISLGLICLSASAYFSIRTTFLSTEFIIMKKFGPIQAIKACWYLTRGRHFWKIFGACWYVWALDLLGLTCLGLGLLVTTPIGRLFWAIGYLSIVGLDAPAGDDDDDDDIRTVVLVKRPPDTPWN